MHCSQDTFHQISRIVSKRPCKSSIVRSRSTEACGLHQCVPPETVDTVLTIRYTCLTISENRSSLKTKAYSVMIGTLIKAMDFESLLSGLENFQTNQNGIGVKRPINLVMSGWSARHRNNCAHIAKGMIQ